MSRYHRMRRGENVIEIAERFGHFVETVWDAPENAELVQLRGRMENVRPNDMLFVPELRPIDVERATDSVHRFKRRGIPAQLRICILDGGEPRASQDYRFSVDGKAERAGTTDPDGFLVEPIAPSARRARIVIGPDEHAFEVRLGVMEPQDEHIGAERRLENLGFDNGVATGSPDEATRRAILRFQLEEDLPPSGELDEATQERLERRHS